MEVMRLAPLAVGLLVLSLIVGCGALEPQVGMACQHPPQRPAPPAALDDVPSLIGRTPEQAAALLEDVPGVDVTWRYHYSTEAGGGPTGYSECWCVPPPDGRVDTVEILETNQLMVYVVRAGPIVGGRAQPVQGWGCDSE